MTYTKRQWFIYRLNQCVSLLAKVESYFDVIIKYTEFSKYKKRVRKIAKNLDKCFSDIYDLHQEVK